MSRFLEKYAALATPRYTSYPPATAFHKGVGPAERRAWIEGLAPGARLSLYLHIPFCASLCWYCGCHMTVANRIEPIARYLEALGREIDAVAAQLPAGCAVSRVHFGGGTPNSLSPDQFEALIGRLRDAFPFADDAEIATELDPRTLTQAHCVALGRAGVGRASLGLQDVSEDVQKHINRIQPFETVRRAADDLRAAGVAALNLDLLYGLPGQTEAHIRRSAEAAASLEPDRLAVFGYAHVPWFKKHQTAIDAALLPGGAERLAQADAAAATLTARGFQRIGFDHFARPEDPMARAAAEGRLRRNFQGYTEDPCAALIGFGASSVSALPQGYVQNEPHLGRYEAAMDTTGEAAVRGVAIDAEHQLIGAAIERLLCDFEVDLAAVATANGRHEAAFDASLEAAGALRADGLVEIDGRKLRLTELGAPYARVAAAYLDPDWSASPTKHSVAV